MAAENLLLVLCWVPANKRNGFGRLWQATQLESKSLLRATFNLNHHIIDTERWDMGGCALQLDSVFKNLGNQPAVNTARLKIAFNPHATADGHSQLSEHDS